MKKNYCILFAIVCLMKSSIGVSEDAFKKETMIYKKTEQGELTMHIYSPATMKKGDKLPAIVFFHGGGWNGGSPSQFFPHCEYLASRGMVAMSAEYRLVKKHKTTPYECVKDGKSAIRWARSNAQKLNIDPDRLAAGGGSAGGHIAAATGTVKGLDEDKDQKISAKPNALMLFNPVFDNGPKGGWGHSRVKDRYKEISPAHNIREGAPPTIAFLGTNDKLIPVATAERYKNKMSEVKSRCELILYEGAGHGFFNQSKEDGKYFKKTVHEADKFLKSLGWLEGEPKI